jgi:hypothetical protein
VVERSDDDSNDVTQDGSTMAQFLNETLTTASGGTNGATDIDWAGGPGVMACQGTFNGATFQLQYSLDGSNWFNVPGADLTITTNDIGAFQMCPCKLRVTWTGGDGSTSVKCRVAPSWQGWWNDATNLPTT